MPQLLAFSLNFWPHFMSFFGWCCSISQFWLPCHSFHCSSIQQLPSQFHPTVPSQFNPKVLLTSSFLQYHHSSILHLPSQFHPTVSSQLLPAVPSQVHPPFPSQFHPAVSSQFHSTVPSQLHPTLLSHFHPAVPLTAPCQSACLTDCWSADKGARCSAPCRRNRG